MSKLPRLHCRATRPLLGHRQQAVTSSPTMARHSRRISSLSRPDFLETQSSFERKNYSSFEQSATPLFILLAQISVAIHWCNPLVWLSFRAFRLSQERHCDDTVLSHGNSAGEYARLLVDAARSAGGFAPTAGLPHASKTSLEQRIRSILNQSMNRDSMNTKQKIVIGFTVVGVLSPFALTGAGNGGQNEKIDKLVLTKKIDAELKYTAAQFFTDCKTEYIQTEGEISREEKQFIISSKFVRKEVEDRQWFVRNLSDSRLVIGSGESSSVAVNVYRHEKGGSLVAVVSILGNRGQTQSFRFFRISENNKITSELKLKDLGIKQPKDNEFVAEGQYFPEIENKKVPLSIRTNGDISAAPLTWMESRWESRNVVNEVHFVWNGVKFVKTVRRAKD